MMRQKRRRVWTSITAAAVLLPVTAALPHAATGPIDGLQTNAGAPDRGTTGPTDTAPLLQVAAGDGGEGGESGGGGEGGEAGVDTARAAEDSVVFLTALDVIAAHYHAGLAAYLAGEHHAGAEMFAHPISEVYADLGDAVALLGVVDFGPDMTKASEIALANAPDAEVEAAAGRVFSALAAAEKRAPASTKTPLTIERAVLADMLNRAAMQYSVALGAENTEPYLDGFGFYTAANVRADKIAAALSQKDPAAATAVTEAREMLAKAYPAITRPDAPPAQPGAVLAAVSKAVLALMSE